VNRARLLTATLVLGYCAASQAYGEKPELRGGAATGVVSSHQLTKIKPGVSKAQVRSWLGAPWRSVQYNDLDEIENEIWEYRGQDASGAYRLHIEFDAHDVVRIVGKIPEQAPGGTGTPAQN